MRRDSLRRLGIPDTLKAPVVKKDTIKAPLAHSELPADLGIARTLHWTRDSLFATGAITLADLLERVAGLTTYHAGWIAAPATTTYLGDFRRLRVFYDGFEMSELNPRAQGAFDLTQINLWSTEEAVIEQTAEEVRVYLRSWRVRNTTPVTRTDVSTGDQQTNLYRGFFGQRTDNGLAFQFGAQQFGTTPSTLFGNSSDQFGMIARLGWSNPRWSFDGFFTRAGRHRGDIFGDQGVDSIPPLESTRTDAYLRAAVGDPDTSAMWGQVLMAGSKFAYTGIRTFTIPAPKTHLDSVLAFSPLDTSVFLAQYVATGGIIRGPLRLSGTARLFGRGGQRVVSPSIRASYSLNRLVVSGYAERKSADSLSRSDITAQFEPLPFVSILAGAGRASDEQVPARPVTSNYARAELGVRLRNLWFLGGVLRRDSVQLRPPHELDTLFVPLRDGSATGVTAGVRGQLWRLVHVDLSAVKWSDSAGFYRPQYQTRSELFVRTNLLQRFPSGNLGILFSAIHEYRSSVRFPLADSGFYRAPGYRTISTLLEIRILTATVSWQFRNLLGERYAQVPFYIMPRQTNFYGVRWEFLN